MLIFDTETLRLQGTDGNGKSQNEVEEANSWESIVHNLDSEMDLE